MLGLSCLLLGGGLGLLGNGLLLGCGCLFHGSLLLSSSLLSCRLLGGGLLLGCRFLGSDLLLWSSLLLGCSLCNLCLGGFLGHGLLGWFLGLCGELVRSLRNKVAKRRKMSQSTMEGME